MATPQVTLYSCIVNQRDAPKIIEYRDDIRYIMFTDDPNLVAPGWEVRPIVWTHTDPVRTSRYHKHHPFNLFPESEYTIWLDATHWPYQSLMSLIGGNDFKLMRHVLRDTVEEETTVCSEFGLDSSHLMRSQFENYKSEGFRDDKGLYSTTCLIRKNTKKSREFAELWWHEISNGSKRDQLSFPYCLWKTGMECDIIPGFCRISYSPFFRMLSHYNRQPIVPLL